MDERGVTRRTNRLSDRAARAFMARHSVFAFMDAANAAKRRRPGQLRKYR